MFAQRPRSSWTSRDGGGGFAGANIQERREYEVPLRERERKDFRRKHQPRNAADPWGRPQRVLQRRNQRSMLKPPPQYLEPLPQREPPLPQRRELPPPAPMMRDPPLQERYFCPNCNCPSCRPEDPSYMTGGGRVGGMYLDSRGANPPRRLPSPDVQVLDDGMRPRYEPMPPPSDGYYPRERLPMKGEEPLRRESSWPRQEQRSGPNWGGGGDRRSGGGARRPLDWDCPSCNAHNLADKTVCYVCSLPKLEGGLGGGQSGGYNGGPRVVRNLRKRGREDRRAGDWDCPQCSAHNFASKTACFKCSIPKPEKVEPNAKPRGGGSGGGGGGRRRGARREIDHRPGDWTCRDCNAHNFKRNVKCFKCDSPKEA